MQALILMGGRGERLRPLTDHVPKPLLPVLGVPAVCYQVQNLRHHGVKNITLSVGYRWRDIARYFGDGSRFGVNIGYSVEHTPLGTGGAIARAMGKLSTDCLVVNGDILADFDVVEMIRARDLYVKKTGASPAIISTVEVRNPSRYGAVTVGSGGRVLRFIEKGKRCRTKTINAGCYLLPFNFLHAIPRMEKFSIERDVFQAGRFPLRAIPHVGPWRDIGTIQDYIEANIAPSFGFYDGKKSVDNRRNGLYIVRAMGNLRPHRQLTRRSLSGGFTISPGWSKGWRKPSSTRGVFFAPNKDGGHNG